MGRRLREVGRVRFPTHVGYVAWAISVVPLGPPLSIYTRMEGDGRDRVLPNKATSPARQTLQASTTTTITVMRAGRRWRLAAGPAAAAHQATQSSSLLARFGA